MNITTIGIDLAKDVFQIHGADARGHKVLSKRLRRNKLAAFMTNLPACKIGMEACGGSHYWSRKFSAMGHEVKLMAPQFVKPYVKANKNDAADAEACCEAVTRPTMRFVPQKAIFQQDIQSLHRIRSRLVSQRTQLSNQTRGLLAEYGIVVARGISPLMRKLPDILEDAENELTSLSRTLFDELYQELRSLDERISKHSKQIRQLARNDERSVRLQTIPGVGELTSTAMLAAIGSGQVFSKGRQVSAWLGLVPKHSSSGDKIRLLGISKRGDKYLRTLFIHGARTVIKYAHKKSDHYSCWINQLVARLGKNKAVVALANKNARIAWAILTSGENFEANYAREFVDNYASA